MRDKIFIAMQPVKVEMIQDYKIPNNTNCITLIVTKLTHTVIILIILTITIIGLI